jgi:hypothetical protein
VTEEERGILRGGPLAGKIIHVQPGHPVLIVPWLPELPPAEIELPRYRWWHRLLRKPVPHPPSPPTFKNLRYVATAGMDAQGNSVYQYEDGLNDATA